jgi:BirA family biotin operon repressor/biotin-[acetyl-CoA-carboxylase] ligase
LSVAVGGAVTEAVSRWVPGRAVQLKWPNDVYVDGRKLCGILVETSPRSPDRLVIGIGVNVENSFADAPSDVSARAVSLTDVAPSRPQRWDVLAAIVEHLDTDLKHLAKSPRSLVERWRERCYLTGKSVSVTDVERTMSGACLGLEDDGSLLIQTEAGPQRCYAGVVNVVE